MRNVLFWVNSAENPLTLPECPNAVVMIDIETGKQTGLKSFPWAYALHISGCAQSWCLVSTYAPDNSLPSQVWRLWADGRSELLCDTGSIMIRTAGGLAYNPQPRASVSRDGSRCVFSSNGGDTSRGPDYCDVYLGMLETPKPEPVPEPIPLPIEAEPDEVVIDYRQYAGKYEFVIRPRADGATDIVMRKLK